MARVNRVIYTDPGGVGWAPVELLARLLAQCLDAELIRLTTRPRIDRVRRSLGELPRRASRQGVCVVLAPQPAHLGSLVTAKYLMSGYSQVAGWVIDSFLDDRIPRMARHHGHFDRLFITDYELVPSWENATGVATSCLPWGSNVLDQPAMGDERQIDILRLGRQPPAWGDDAETAAACDRLGLRFATAPPFDRDPLRGQSALTSAMRSTKYVLAFTNLLSPAAYTHPTRDYVTARWTESLASGAAVAGQPPGSESGRQLLWDQGLLRISATDLSEGLERVREGAAAWTPEHARAVRQRALETLDWRLRIRQIADSMSLSAPRLDDELERWQRAVDDAS